jgi:signal transduction histidine kinase
MLSSSPLLNWALVAVSLFNTILLAWLGLTVLLNADRRAWGIWLGGGGLLLGAAFFLSHTMILGLGLYSLGWNVIFWWLAGMVPAIILPVAWYVSMLWYAGYWERPGSDLRRRQRPWLGLALLLLVLGLLALILGFYLLATPRSLLAQVRLYFRWSIAGVPLLALGYSLYIILCTALSLDALRRPGPSARVMGQLARRRARPWLAAASVALLLVGLLVSGTMAWLAEETHRAVFADVYTRSVETIAWLDLIVATLIGISILLLGQAVVSYEVFTGKTLPRRGLTRHWYRMILLAAGYSLLVGGSLALGFRSLYTVILASLLMTLALALLSWRSFVERERTISLLRPFLTSQHLYDRLLTPVAAAEVDIAAPFAALCGQVLGARTAYLAPLGPLAPLVGAPLVYPSGTESDLPSLADLAGRFELPETMAMPLEPDQYGGAGWAVPLWSQRGLSGVLLLGDKRDGGLYAQEEIEIARISCERLLDTRASAELGRRLMALQREQLLQNQMVDLRARRVLHDEVLPNLQAALIEMDGSLGDGDGGQAAALLSDSHRLISDLLGEIPTVTTAEVARLGFIPVLRRSVEGEFAGAFDEVIWHIELAAGEQAARLPAVTAETLFYATREAVRNAARHGRGEGQAAPFRLQIALRREQALVVTVEDTGQGLDWPGNEQETGGQGLALYSTMMAVVGGSLTVDSSPGRYTCVRLSLP